MLVTMMTNVCSSLKYVTRVSCDARKKDPHLRSQPLVRERNERVNVYTKEDTKEGHEYKNYLSVLN